MPSYESARATVTKHLKGRGPAGWLRPQTSIVFVAGGLTSGVSSSARQRENLSQASSLASGRSLASLLCPDLQMRHSNPVLVPTRHSPCAHVCVQVAPVARIPAVLISVNLFQYDLILTRYIREAPVCKPGHVPRCVCGGGAGLGFRCTDLGQATPHPPGSLLLSAGVLSSLVLFSTCHLSAARRYKSPV